MHKKAQEKKEELETSYFSTPLWGIQMKANVDIYPDYDYQGITIRDPSMMETYNYQLYTDPTDTTTDINYQGTTYTTFNTGAWSPSGPSVSTYDFFWQPKALKRQVCVLKLK